MLGLTPFLTFLTPFSVAGLYRHFLPVKDLASTAMLEVFNTRYEKAKTVQKLLEFLFDFYGPLLVIKSDNGIRGRTTITSYHQTG